MNCTNSMTRSMQLNSNLKVHKHNPYRFGLSIVDLDFGKELVNEQEVGDA